MEIREKKKLSKETDQILIEILAKAESMFTAQEVRHLIKDYIIFGESRDIHVN